jgi:prephenate dehydrogenase
MLRRICILGTGLLGASAGLALRAAGFAGAITGWNRGEAGGKAALAAGAIGQLAGEPLEAARDADLILLAMPVHATLDMMERLAPLLGPEQLVTDVGSTKAEICALAARLYNRPGSAGFLPGHPMAGKERGGAELAEAGLFQNTVWIFTDADAAQRSNGAAALAAEWRQWVERMGARAMDLDPARHDELVAWASHLPQFLSTALSALLLEEMGDAPELKWVGGRALREMTRLGASPYSMWRDIALTNTEPITRALHALEQRLAHLRENLKTPELREEFERANKFRKDLPTQ